MRNGFVDGFERFFTSNSRSWHPNGFSTVLPSFTSVVQLSRQVEGRSNEEYFKNIVLSSMKLVTMELAGRIKEEVEHNVNVFYGLGILEVSGQV